jgi:hypothetical protein
MMAPSAEFWCEAAHRPEFFPRIGRCPVLALFGHLRMPA